jgi:hypothetical protein
MNIPLKLVLSFIQMIGVGVDMSTTCGANTRAADTGTVAVGRNGERRQTL